MVSEGAGAEQDDSIKADISRLAAMDLLVFIRISPCVTMLQISKKLRFSGSLIISQKIITYQAFHFPHNVSEYCRNRSGDDLS